MAEKKKTCFIIMPISTSDPFLDKYRDGVEHFKHVLQCLLVPSVEAAGYKAISPIAKGSDLIQAEIISNLEQSDMVLCDMSCLNPNVFFEFGIRTSLNKPVCVVKDKLTEKVPFDTGILNHQEYRETLEPWELADEIKKLAEHIKTSEERCKGENMLWKYFGLRTEAKPYTGDSGTDAKMDYLTMQMDSLRHQVGNIHQRSERHVVQPEGSHMLDNESLFPVVLSYLPDGVEPTAFESRSDGDIQLTYTGPFSPINRYRLIQKIIKQYGVKLHLEREPSEETEDSQQGAEDDA
ncbi:MAG: hypothetical protein CEE38_20435 [Planctomycetes bacterium B3_Pla]|nr:MAG: hypothetical protein CEE38_20435 [Planctomycetes bacterium B3_Pla]